MVEYEEWAEYAKLLQQNGPPLVQMASGNLTVDVAVTGGGGGKMQFELYIGEKEASWVKLTNDCRVSWELNLSDGQRYATLIVTDERHAGRSFQPFRQINGKATYSVKISDYSLEAAKSMFPATSRWCVNEKLKVRGRSPLVRPLGPAEYNGVKARLLYISMDLYSVKVKSRPCFADRPAGLNPRCKPADHSASPLTSPNPRSTPSPLTKEEIEIAIRQGRYLVCMNCDTLFLENPARYGIKVNKDDWEYILVPGEQYNETLKCGRCGDPFRAYNVEAPVLVESFL